MRQRVQCLVFCWTAAIVALHGDALFAQTIGPVRFQLVPHCNVMSLTFTFAVSTYAVHGTDNQCGAATPATVTGEATLRPDGLFSLGLTVIGRSPDIPTVSTASHVAVTLAANSSGQWGDSAGRGGVFLINPPGSPSGEPRPNEGSALSSVIALGDGLFVGTQVDGSKILEVVFGDALQPGRRVALADHNHSVNTSSTMVGAEALQRARSGVGFGNSAFGNRALFSTSTAGTHNTGIGYGALEDNASGFNSALGAAALQHNQTGTENTAVGFDALNENVIGSRNTALGHQALNASRGSDNIGIGRNAGVNLTTGTNNIYIGTPGNTANESGTIRIGVNHTAAHIAGIHNSSVSAGSAMDVFVDSNGKLGFVPSSARFKTDIQPVRDETSALLALRPVTFRYRDSDASQPLEYGLIAEEVARVLPALVINDPDGKPLTVKYHALPALLLSELQRLMRERAEQDGTVAQQSDRILQLEAELAALAARLLALEQKSR